MLYFLTAAGLSEVCDGTELCVDRPPAEPAVVQVLDGGGGVHLAAELDVNVAHLNINIITAVKK